MKQLLIIALAVFSLYACKKKELSSNHASYGLQVYLDSKAYMPTGSVIACAGGTSSSFMGDSENPISVMFYVEEGATNFRFYETNSVNIDSSDYNKYFPKDYEVTNLFNGVMKRFRHPSLSDERWGIVTYETEGKVHVSDPIRIKAAVTPTEDISPIVTIIESGVNPEFDWSFENEPNNVIYFSVVSDKEDNMISGTYTNNKFWTFYSLSNVVLNVTPNPNPALSPDSEYNYNMMGISDDNWVHTFVSRTFRTH